jgi:hypothetical protein
MLDPNSPMLEDAVHRLAPFLDEIVFAGGISLGTVDSRQGGRSYSL